LLPVLLVAVERKKQRWCPGGEDGSSSSLCRDHCLCFLFPSPFPRLASLFITALPLFLDDDGAIW
jgi:hypothetical protein